MKVLKNDWYVLIVLIIMIFISMNFIFSFKTKKEVKLDEVKIANVLKNNSVAIMLEKIDKTGYEESTSSSFPSFAYKFNEKLSGCVDEEGYEIQNGLTYNYSNNSVIVKTRGSTFCYLYFDYLFDGNGTENEPYLIQSIEDLVELSNAVNSGITYNENYFSLTKTLDFNDSTSYEDSSTKRYGDINNNGIIEEVIIELTTGSGFIPIGLSDATILDKYFSGNFNGNENKIDNLYIYNTHNVNMSIGLFGLTKNANISNLGVSGLVKTYLQSNAGGIVGYGIDSLITNCYNEANIYSEVGSYSVGGIAGALSGTISNSYNSGTISNGNNTGGLLGVSLNVTINDSYNVGKIVKNNLGYNAGGLIGRDNSANSIAIITNSYNNGSFNVEFNNTSTNNVGGIIGRVEGKVNLKTVYNKANINLSEVTDFAYNINLGGLVGYGRNGANIVIGNSYNIGNISNGNRLGGLVGYLISNSNLVIDSSYNIGILSNVSSFLDASVVIGGLVAFNNNSKIIILNSYNIGDISSSFTTSVVSGILGISNATSYGYIYNCYNIGNVASNYISTGIMTCGGTGINNCDLNNVYNLGDISGRTITNGIIYVTSNNVYNISNAYHLNSITGSNITGITTAMLESDIKSEVFVNLLNSNLESINLSEIDENLDEFTLNTWKLGSEKYPVFSYQ